MIACVRSVINVVASEEGVSPPTAFSKVQFDRSAGVQTRLPVPLPALRQVQRACVDADDDRRWLVALIADTGLRLSEAVGLARTDIVFDTSEGGFIDVRPHSWRPLKTASSRRCVPLVGSALWAAKRSLAYGAGSDFVFPRYVRDGAVNANSASATLNKWLGQFVPDGCTIHSMRHTLRDRLRAVECPSDVVDQIGGWTTAGVGQGYGSGYPLAVLRKWMESIV
jgi:integrase